MTKVVIYTRDIVGSQMAGSGIRTWELAKHLSKKYEVVIVAESKNLTDPPFEIITRNDPQIKETIKTAQFIIGFSIPLPLLLLAKLHGVRIILDVYCPHVVENLERLALSGNCDEERFLKEITNSQNFAIRMADSYICASETQIDFWFGHLLSLNQLSSKRYLQHQSHLKTLIDAVPFGLSSTPPQKKGEGFRRKFCIGAEDKVLLWGGGIWNWFDPITLLEAIHIISSKRNDIKLIFMGVKHPNEAIPEMEMGIKTLQRAKELGLLDRLVFINYDWIPYEQRQNFLLDADFGVSTHFPYLETRFSFRTRMLDYLWAGLPMIATEGDYFGKLIQEKQLGIAVPDGNPDKLAEAIEILADDPQRIAQIKENIKNIRPEFFWENTVAPIEKMIQFYLKLPKSTLGWKGCLDFIRHIFLEKGVWNLSKAILLHQFKKISHKTIFKKPMLEK